MDDKIRDVFDEYSDQSRKLSDFQFIVQQWWSYGDVENNGVFYHPNLTHYAHKAFEEFFHKRKGLHYVDLSRDSDKSAQKRAELPAKRMTFAVSDLYQHMSCKMEAGDTFQIGIQAEKVDAERIAVIAGVYDAKSIYVGAVIWIRWALLLPSRRSIEIPEWFPWT